LLAVWLLPVAVNFGPALQSDRLFAFRDAAHYYPPLLRIVSHQWSSQLPLWNPLEERGRPLWADPTAAVLYPGQLIFALPCSFATAYKVYIVGHILLCGLTSLIAARRLQLDWAAAAVASVSYALGGSVVFQYCNLPYLIGAAWLPLGASAVLGVVQGHGRWSQLELVAVLVVLVLGGDPQAAYLLGVMSVVAAGLAVWPLRRQLGWPAALWPLGAIVGRLALAGAIAAGVSAAQWLPTLAWTMQSERVGAEPTVGSGAADTLEHHSARYQFSIGPWRWPELFWPNASGRLFPRHERWIRVIPAEGRAWAPSLYMGVVPLLLAIQAMRLRGGRLADRWLTWLVLLGVVGSLGRYGLGWLWSEAAHAWQGADRVVQHEIGGLYWFLTLFLPGFDLFRYPAKLWTWAALGLSVLAGIRLQDATSQQRAPIPRRWLAAYAGVTVVLLLTLVALRPWITALWATAPSDGLFGPLAVGLSHRHLTASLVQGLLVSVGVFALSPRKNPATGSSPPGAYVVNCCSGRRFGWCVAAITAVDLTLAGHWMVATAPAQAWTAGPGQSIANLAQHVGERPLLARLQSGTWYPSEWAQTSADDRLEASVRWDSLTARPKYPMLQGVGTLQGSTSFSSREHRALLELIDDLSADDLPNFIAVLERLGVNYVCAPPGIALTALMPMEKAPQMTFARDARWLHLANSLPRAWVVHEAVAIEPPATLSVENIKQHLRAVFLTESGSRDFRRQVVVSAHDLAQAGATASELTPEVLPERPYPEENRIERGDRAVFSGEEECRVGQRNASSLLVHVRMRQAGWLVINETYDPGWRAVVRSKGTQRAVPVARGNFVMRAIPLPPGRHDVVLTYDPPSVRQGLWVTGLSLAAAVILGAGLRLVRGGCRSRGLTDDQLKFDN
jgi:hypothetical protein